MVLNRDTDNALSANDLRRTVGCYEIGMTSLDVANLVHHGIILLIRNRRGIVLVIGCAPRLDFGAKLSIASLGRVVVIKHARHARENLLTLFTLRLAVVHVLAFEQRIKLREDFFGGVFRLTFKHFDDRILKGIVFFAVNSSCIIVFGTFFFGIGVRTRNNFANRGKEILENVDDVGGQFTGVVHFCHFYVPLLFYSILLFLGPIYKVRVNGIISA